MNFWVLLLSRAC